MKKKFIFSLILSIATVSSAYSAEEIWTKWMSLKHKGITSCELGDAVNSVFIACNQLARKKHSHASVIDRQTRNFSNKNKMECCDESCTAECKACIYTVEYRCKIYLP
jgi:hypothetical protein